LKGNRGKVKESIGEGVVHVGDVVALLECHAMGDFDVGTIIAVSASTVVVYICNFERKRIVRIGVCLPTGVMAIEDGIDGNICHAHGNNFYGYGGQVLKIWYFEPTKVHTFKSI
jgi:hypothetical protein